jgi:hypothetical protein
MRTLTLAVLCLLVFPASALAKGPSAATIEGPGLTKRLAIDGSGSWDEGGPFVTLVEETAFFSATWGGGHAMLGTRPPGPLGPRYRVTYDLPGPNGRVDPIRQDLYPYARGGPLTFTPAGQPFFDQRTIGGWFRGKPRLRAALVQVGLPPPRRPAAAAGDEGAGIAAAWPAAAIAALGLAACALVAGKRRGRTATA